jgi:hypothetical protein
MQRELHLEDAVWVQAGVRGSSCLVGLFSDLQDGGSTSVPNDCKFLPAYAAASYPVKQYSPQLQPWESNNLVYFHALNHWVCGLSPSSGIASIQKTQGFGNWVYSRLHVRGGRHLLCWVPGPVIKVNTF